MFDKCLFAFMIDEFDSTISCLRPSQILRGGNLKESEDSHASHCQAIGGHPVDEREWKWVPVWGGNRNSSQTPSPTQMPLQNRYEALDVEGQPDDIEENDLPSELPNLRFICQIDHHL
ncbi:hypothetical protein HGM15179_011353 [Zosterops borbonicus]|uniref:Uncharacterized protein n=1 Tax=Zosterops borbonicus TaxID=364589 RepID=A0A8K1GBV0_9PASS|nr:hypothetical protein HGM15179_011353 [Zosterops borbonicus]